MLGRRDWKRQIVDQAEEMDRDKKADEVRVEVIADRMADSGYLIVDFQRTRDPTRARVEKNLAAP